MKHPASLSWVEAAAVWMANVTVFGALIDIARLGKGDAVIIRAASSSIGIAAIQVAKMVGAISIATIRTSAKKAALLDARADHVIASEEENLVARVSEITRGQGGSCGL